jgi:hypothetical protein
MHGMDLCKDADKTRQMFSGSPPVRNFAGRVSFSCNVTVNANVSIMETRSYSQRDVFLEEACIALRFSKERNNFESNNMHVLFQIKYPL